ncbi:PilZ domain-containing protein [Stigmatella sp. ncwal1]|uniref:PilZ domain-containing protein n=1 Tax=Stigmatella ashevillensis TaxID=2995309 RepID=A0ABT5D208_9BACT|nr:PilZ domain-containing protein [Stigmatella ashevillena]MDC0707695.1 PilZ domain-containing protein [Stigmatella ashevillena]
MVEKRRYRRFKQQYTVRFGTEDLSESGFTGDISKGGAFIVSNHLVPLDTRIHVQVHLDPKNFVMFEAVVQRHRLVPPELRDEEPDGFGVRFLYPGEVVADLVHTGSPTFELHFSSPEQLQCFQDRELRPDKLFIATDKVLRIQEKVLLSLCLDFARTTVEHEATVVHIALAHGEGTHPGVTVTFADPDELEARIQPYLVRPPQ